MYSVIRSWFQAYIIAPVNSEISGTINDLIEVDTDLSFDKIASSDADKGYFLKISGIEETEKIGNPQYTVSCVCELSFELVNKDYAEYGNIITGYVLKIIRKLKRNATNINTSGYSFNEVVFNSIKAEGLSDIENQYLKPRITFDLKIIDTNS